MIEQPNQVWATTTDGVFRLMRSGPDWRANGISLTISEEGAITLQECQASIFKVEIQWNRGVPEGSKVLGDDWERSYGTLGWAEYDSHRILPWYFLATHGETTLGWGVKTMSNAIVYWTAAVEAIHMTLDLRSGNRPLRLSGRRLELATVVNLQGHAPFETLREFLKLLCSTPRRASKPVYGANDWYYAYGKNTAEGILDDSKRISDWSENADNRPFSVIDDGWQASDEPSGVIWDAANAKFRDMPELAHRISSAGCHPGIWIRPLECKAKLDPAMLMGGNTLDPSNPGSLAIVRENIHRLHQWGYQLIKHDYSTFDLTGLWGFGMTDGLAGHTRTFHDQTRTTAEILLDLYRTIRDAAGDSLIIGCNTVGHLAAGLFELQRTGDDTSGREWPRTVKMGVNTLAFRGAQEGRFFGADADCVGVTTDVPWEKTKLWLELVSRSGTPLFVSAQQKAVGPEQITALKRALSVASRPQPVGEPLDWLSTRTPQKWKLGGETLTFEW